MDRSRDHVSDKASSFVDPEVRHELFREKRGMISMISPMDSIPIYPNDSEI